MAYLYARVATEWPARFLGRLCTHAAAMASPRAHRMPAHAGRDAVEVTAEWTDSHGRIGFDPWGSCELTAEAGALAIAVHATDAASAERIAAVIARDLERFGRGLLTVEWRER